jgi:uncharacterized membrane protein
MPRWPDDRRRWWLVSGVLALLGVAVAFYLTLVHYDEELLVCGVTSGCKTVQSSKYSELAGIPVALYGLAMYLSLLALGIARWIRPRFASNATLAAAGIALVGALYALYLTYVELFVIDAICQWCVISAILTILLCIIECSAVLRVDDADLITDS